MTSHSHDEAPRPPGLAGQDAPAGGEQRQEPAAPAAPAPSAIELAARAMMQPESYDPAYRYYHGGWSG